MAAGVFAALPDSVWFEDDGFLYEQGQTLGLVVSTDATFAPTASQVLTAIAWVALVP